MENVSTPLELLDFMSKILYGYLGRSGHLYHYDDENFNLKWYAEYILQNYGDISKNLCGNCWDQVEFERKWFQDHGYEIKTIYEMVLLDYNNDYPSHSFLIYEDENNKWNWFENADFANRGIHTFDTIEELLDYQYHKYLELLETYHISSDEIKKIVMTEFDKPKEKITAREYIDYVLNSKLINQSKFLIKGDFHERR